MTSGSTIPRSYAELLARHAPRSISSDDECREVQRQIDALINRSALGPDEEAYLALPGELVMTWERDHFAWEELSPLLLVRALTEDN